jgi:hypothetical protein
MALGEVLGNERSRALKQPTGVRRPRREARAPGVIGRAPEPVSIGLPQPPQNLAEGSLPKPQFAHAAPHSAQKRLVAAFSAKQSSNLGNAFAAPRGTSQFKHNRITLG